MSWEKSIGSYEPSSIHVLPSEEWVAPAPKGLGDSTTSSIASLSEQKSLVPQRPRLHHARLLIDLAEEVVGIASDGGDFLKEQKEIESAARKERNLEKQQIFLQRAQESENCDFYSHIKDALEYVAPILWIAAGASSGATPLALFGAVLLAHRLIKDTITVEKIASYYTESIEEQKAIAEQVESFLFYVQCGAVIGSIVSAATIGIWRITPWMEALQVASTLSLLVAEVGLAITQARMTAHSGRLMTLNALDKIGQMDESRRANEAGEMFRTIQVYNELAKSAF